MHPSAVRSFILVHFWQQMQQIPVVSHLYQPPDCYNKSLILIGPSAHLLSCQLIWACALWPFATSIWAVNLFRHRISVAFSHGLLFCMCSLSSTTWFSLTLKRMLSAFVKSGFCTFCGCHHFFSQTDAQSSFSINNRVSRSMSLKIFLTQINSKDSPGCRAADWWCLIMVINVNGDASAVGRNVKCLLERSCVLFFLFAFDVWRFMLVYVHFTRVWSCKCAFVLAANKRTWNTM